MTKRILLLGAVLTLPGCAPAEMDMLPEAVRAVATRAASSTPDRLLVVAGTFGDTAMTFATRQALVTAGVVVQDSPTDADSTIAVLEFVSAAETEGGWRVRTARTGGGAASVIDALASEERVEWLVQCGAEQCEVRDSTAW
ncbi:MAG TPA: hypothetical protein VFU06_15070 [Longimicrobiales bacterium]|nr:hypothetical protein [Longimicrobiales bacterium]